MKIIFLSLLVFCQTGFSLETDQTRLMIHLLDYLAKDYGGAVANGKVINEQEYREQIEFIEKVVEIQKNDNKLAGDGSLQTKISRLETAIEKKKSAKDVAFLAREIQQNILLKVKIALTPEQWPNISKGRQLFTQNCESCHGSRGDGTGPLAKGQQPPPRNLTDNDYMAKMSAFQVFNSIRIGVPRTGMRPFSELTDEDIWNLSFYVLSIRHEKPQVAPGNGFFSKANLLLASQKSDEEIRSNWQGPEGSEMLAALRTHSLEGTSAFLEQARELLRQALNAYKSGDAPSAKTLAIQSYLNGIEPIESKINLRDHNLTLEIEKRMGKVRSLLAEKKSYSDIENAAQEALLTIDIIDTKLNESSANSPWVTAGLAAAIPLREGLEAILLIIVLLGVVRVTNNGATKKAMRWIHAGWLTALALGVGSWFMSGWLIQMSGLDCEIMEGAITAIALIIVLYLGFWLHSKVEISKWKAFIEGKVQNAMSTNNLLGLAAISFLAVFREAIETVLFLRALMLEEGQSFSVGIGFSAALVGVIFLAWGLLKFSEKIPVRKLFSISSIVMVCLAFALLGKGIHAFQEGGMLSVNSLPFNLRWETLGIYPTLETTLAQSALLILIFSFLIIDQKIGRRRSSVA